MMKMQPCPSSSRTVQPPGTPRSTVSTLATDCATTPVDGCADVSIAMSRVSERSHESDTLKEARYDTEYHENDDENDTLTQLSTSWLLPRRAFLAWRCVSAAGTTGIFLALLQTDERGVRAFSIDAYRVTTLCTYLLLLPPTFDALPFPPRAAPVWGCFAGALLFALALALSAAAATRQWAHEAAVVPWLATDVVVGNTNVAELNAVVAACAAFAAYLMAVGAGPNWIQQMSGSGGDGGGDKETERWKAVLYASGVFATCVLVVASGCAARAAGVSAWRRRRRRRAGTERRGKDKGNGKSLKEEDGEDDGSEFVSTA